MDAEILDLISELFDNLDFNRSQIVLVVKIINNFIKNTYNPFLLKKFEDYVFNSVNDEVLKEIKAIFKQSSSPFSKYNSEKKIITVFQNMEVYRPVDKYIVGYRQKKRIVKNETQIKNIPIYAVHISVADSLKAILEFDGLYEELISYMEYLYNNKTFLQNFIQAELWSEMLQQYGLTKDLLLPLFIFFDELKRSCRKKFNWGNLWNNTLFSTRICIKVKKYFCNRFDIW